MPGAKKPVADKKKPVANKKKPVVDKKKPVSNKKKSVADKKKSVANKKKLVSDKKRVVLNVVKKNVKMSNKHGNMEKPLTLLNVIKKVIQHRQQQMQHVVPKQMVHSPLNRRQNVLRRLVGNSVNRKPVKKIIIIKRM